MKIALIQPPIEDFYFTPIRSFPLGLSYIAASLQHAGHDVEIMDFLSVRSKPKRVNDTRFDHLKEYYRPDHLSPFGMFKHLMHYGVSFSEIKQRIARSDAAVFGIASLFSAYADSAIKIAGIIKKMHPQSTVILGGGHAHDYARDLLHNVPSIDLIIRGEGETTFALVLAHLNDPSKVPGIAYRIGNDIVCNDIVYEQNLDALPWPARNLLDLELYAIKNKRYTQILTTRGCPMQCSFCSMPQFMGASLRHRSIDTICNEIIYCYDERDIRIFDIEDDNFTFNKDWAKELLRSLIKRLGDRTIEITAMNGLYYPSLDEELLGLLNKAGMRRLNLSIVTQSKASSDGMQRTLDVKHCRSIIEAARALDMHVTVYFIIGLPGETIDEMLGSLALLSTLPILIGPSMYYHVPGSPLFGELLSRGSVRREDYPFFRSTAMHYEDENFKRIDIATIFRLTRIVNYTKAIDASNIMKLCADPRILSATNKCVVSEKALNANVLGAFLLHAFLRDKTVYSFRRSKEENLWCYTFIKERASQRVIDHFFMLLERNSDLIAHA
ncbi:MAG: B12-binding domain-containing radical SAM protein [Candidatus Omnitrophica bacterium]|nr:B12-binding domain-containing radical SAM protein [Candidatus Omnitrophota bacterium]